ncbi:MAG: ABC transporter substrate-binding protein [Bacilli bacterium]
MIKKFLVSIIIIIIASTSFYLIYNKHNKNTNLIKVKVAEVTHSVFYVPWYIAIEKGYFKDEGLDIEVVLTPGADKTAASVLSNDVNIGFSGVEATI